MTVAELIEKLKGLPQDALVCVPERDGGAPDVAYEVALNPYKDYFPQNYIVIS